MRQRLEKEIKLSLYEKKIAAILRRAFERDTEGSNLSDILARQSYRAAYKLMKDKPYYLSLMVSDALLDRMEPFTLNLTTSSKNFMRPKNQWVLVPLNALLLVLAMGLTLAVGLWDPFFWNAFIEKNRELNKLAFLAGTLVIYVPLTTAVRGLIYLIKIWFSPHRTGDSHE
jgi:hypothetical protein